MRPRYEVQVDKGTKGGKWTGGVVHTVLDMQDRSAPKIVLAHETEEAARLHCERLNSTDS